MLDWKIGVGAAILFFSMGGIVATCWLILEINATKDRIKFSGRGACAVVEFFFCMTGTIALLQGAGIV